MKKLWLLLLLAGCYGQPITDVVVQRDIPVVVPDAQPMVMNPTSWKVLTLAQLEEIVKNNTTVLYFALDSNNYANLQLNLIEIQRYIKEQKAVIAMLKKINADRAGQSPIPQKDTNIK